MNRVLSGLRTSNARTMIRLTAAPGLAAARAALPRATADTSRDGVSARWMVAALLAIGFCALPGQTWAQDSGQAGAHCPRRGGSALALWRWCRPGAWGCFAVYTSTNGGKKCTHYTLVPRR